MDKTQVAIAAIVGFVAVCFLMGIFSGDDHETMLRKAQIACYTNHGADCDKIH